jgi:ubiquitin
MALKIIGNLMQARRNVADDQRVRREDENTRRMVNQAKENYGKTSISKVDKSNSNQDDFVDFEEIE